MKISRLCLMGLLLVLALATCGASAAEVLLSENFDAIPNGKLPAGFSAYDGKWEVINGKLVGHSPNTSTLSRIVFGDAHWTNYELSATVTFTWVADAKRWTSLMHRVQPNGGPPYSHFAIRQGTTAANGLEIASRTARHTWDVRAALPYKSAFAIGRTHDVRVVVFGEDVWGFIDGELVISLRYAVQDLQGQAGLHVCGSTVAFDNVVVRSIVAEDLLAMGIAMPTPAPKLTRDTMPKIIAHRGASGVAPENTPAAFQRAIDIGADWIELDVQYSKDGHLVIIHDASVDRTAKGNYSGSVASLSLEQIRTLDAGTWKNASFSGEKVPTLPEVFATFSNAVFLIEIKATGVEAQVAAAIREAGMTQNVVVQSFNVETVRRFQAIMPEVPSGVLFNNPAIAGPIAKAESFYTQTKAAGGTFAALAHAAVSPEVVQYLKARGLSVYAWTVDDENAMRRMINAGVDGIITNYPERLKKLLHSEVQ